MSEQSTYPRLPDGTLHPVYVAQVKGTWRAARNHLEWAAHSGREAQRVWDDALERELTAHREMRAVLEELGEELPATDPSPPPRIK